MAFDVQVEDRDGRPRWPWRLCDVVAVPVAPTTCTASRPRSRNLEVRACCSLPEHRLRRLLAIDLALDDRRARLLRHFLVVATDLAHRFRRMLAPPGATSAMILPVAAPRKIPHAIARVHRNLPGLASKVARRHRPGERIPDIAHARRKICRSATMICLARRPAACAL